MEDTIAVPPALGLRIRWTGQDGQAVEREIDDEVTIGRGAGCDILIDDATISRSHARIRVVDGGLAIEDLGSRNGTLVNGERVASADLRPGDTFTLGRQSLEVIDAGLTPRRTAISSDGSRGRG